MQQHLSSAVQSARLSATLAGRLNDKQSLIYYHQDEELNDEIASSPVQTSNGFFAPGNEEYIEKSSSDLIKSQLQQQSSLHDKLNPTNDFGHHPYQSLTEEPSSGQLASNHERNRGAVGHVQKSSFTTFHPGYHQVDSRGKSSLVSMQSPALVGNRRRSELVNTTTGKDSSAHIN